MEGKDLEVKIKEFQENERYTLDKVVEHLRKLDYVGEESNQKIMYLIGTSRKLKPKKTLKAIVHGLSSGGKNALVNGILKLIPKDETLDITRLTKQALFYMGEEDPYCLKNKFVVVTEAEGVKDARYAIRSLISEDKISLITVKNGESKKIELEGPISFADTTTKDYLDDETENRMLDFYIDESENQTKAIHEIQANQYLLGNNHNPEKIIEFHHTLQKILSPNIKVKILFARKIEFPSYLVRFRRDFPKFLGLIEAHAFLHQLVREHFYNDSGEEYIEATVGDYRVIYELYHPMLSNSLNEMSPAMREFYQMLNDKFKENKFSREEIVGHTGLTLREVRWRLGKLVNLELVKVVQGNKGKKYIYEIVPEKFVPKDEILHPDVLEQKLKKEGM